MNNATAEAGSGAGKGGAGKGRVLLLGLSVVLLIFAGLLLFAGPLLYRMSVLDLTTARTGLHEVAMCVLAVSGVAALAGLIWALVGKKQRAAIVAVLVMMAAGVGGGSLYAQWVMKSDLPPINDVQTDWTLPVAFTEKALREREHAGAIRVRDDAVVPDGQGLWSGMSFAEAQGKFYDQLKPLIVKQAVAETTLAAARAAKRLGWDVMLENPPEGMVEAVYHSPWYGLVYDIAVRIVPEGAGSRIDVRSTSRDPVSDMGENAAQVKQLIDEISLELR